MSCCRGKTTGKPPQKIDKKPEPPSDENRLPIVPVQTADPNMKKYSVTIKTGNYRSSGTRGPVYLKIFGGDNQQTEDILLKPLSDATFFTQDSKKELEVSAIDIGKPQRIIIRHEDKANGWYIEYVEILVHGFRVRFVANRWLDETKHDRKLFAELFGSEQPAAEYNIEVQTGSEQSEPLDSPVYIQLFGTTNTTPKIFLESKNASFVQDSEAKFNVESNNVGQIQKIIIGHEGLGTVKDWYLQSVKVRTDAQQHEFPAKLWLSPTKDKKVLFVELNRRAPSPPLYTMTIRTGEVQRAETTAKIQMTLRGSDGAIEAASLQEHTKSDQAQLFQRGSVDQFEIQHGDIGTIESVTIGFDDDERKAAWLLDSLEVKYRKTVYHFRGHCWLSSRLGSNFSWITMRPDTNNDDVVYKLTIHTGDFGTDANVTLCIYGEKQATKNLALTTTRNGARAQFNKDSQLDFDIKASDVGKIQKINIGHDGQGNDQQWALNTVQITKHDEHYIFQANRSLSARDQTFIDLFPEEPVVYKITVTTSSEDDASTDSGVFMTIYGDKGRTKQFQLLNPNQDSDTLFKQGQTSEFDMEFNDVGKIHKINIGQDGKGLRPMWHLDTVQIRTGVETYKFHADKVLDLSMPYIDLTPTPPVVELSTRSSSPVSSISEKPDINETMYKVSVRYAALQQSSSDDEDDEAELYAVIFGVNGQTKRMPLSKNAKGEIELTTTDVGEISKIVLGCDGTKHTTTRTVHTIVIRRGNEVKTFKINRSIDQNTEMEFTPSPIDEQTSTSDVKRKEKTKEGENDDNTSGEEKTFFCQMKRAQSARPHDKKRNDAEYTIKVRTGERTFSGTVVVKIRGEHGLVTIPLENTKSGAVPFQSKAADEFTHRTTNVGKIQRITVECSGLEKKNTWHMRKIQVIKRGEVYNFIADVRLDAKTQKVTLHPLDQRPGDYVQSELRRLKENLRKQSAKLHAPKHKAHEPFVYNDLRPYFDTSTVDRALYEPVEIPSGYYTRVTALRVVEPWEAHGMDYGVSYELLKQRRSRGDSSKRSSSTHNGLMMLPPLSLPYGGQIAYVNSAGRPNSRSSSTTNTQRSSSKQNGHHVQVTATHA